MYAIGRHFGIDSKVVKELDLEYGIDVVHGLTPARPLTAEWLHQEYVVNQRSLADIAQEAGVSSRTIRTRANELGIPLRSKPRSAPTVPPTAEWIYQQHVVNHRPFRRMAQEAGVSHKSLRAKAKQWGIPFSLDLSASWTTLSMGVPS